MTSAHIAGRILLVEDEAAIADAVAFMMGQEGLQVVTHTLGRDALVDFQARGADLVILDIGLPDMSGLDVCRELRRRSSVPVLFLTARNSETDLVVGLELGGDDYMTKPFSSRELVARVRAMLRRQAREQDPGPCFGLPPEAGDTLFVVQAERGCIRYAGAELPLTRHEYLILALLLSEPGRVFSRAQIMDRVWESPDTSLERAVDSHIKSLRAKLKRVIQDFDPIVTKRGFGYSVRADRP